MAEATKLATDADRKEVSPMQKITTFLMFNDQAEAAVSLYLSVFKDSKLVSTIPGPDGGVMGLTFEIAGQEFNAMNGGSHFAQTLLEHDLVDELRLMVFPVVLGTGKRLFGATTDKKRLQLVDSKIVGDGVAILIHQPKDAVS